MTSPKPNLDLALIGNGRIAALVDAEASIVWARFPAFDGDPVFCCLLGDGSAQDARGVWAVDVFERKHVTRRYLDHTAVVVIRVTDRSGGVLEITDCWPRFTRFGGLQQPMTTVRRVRRIAGSPRIVVRVRPMFQYGRTRPSITSAATTCATCATT